MIAKKLEEYKKKITINKEIIKTLKETKTKDELDTILLRFQ
jgi:hypothetical protein|tara:strand:- start:513 stop:635 length:123 start_codon:yes stop_codon:yes gene_type:complete